MTYRIPPSLNWLINKRSRIAGNIIIVKKKLSKVQHLIDQLNQLESNLKSIDNSLALHEVKIDLENIKPIRPQTHLHKLAKFPHGSQLNLVLKFLKSNNCQSATTLDISNHIIYTHLEYDDVPLPKKEASRIASQILARLYRRNKVIKIHNPKSNKLGLWQLNSNINTQ